MEYCEGGDLKTLLKNCKKSSDYVAEDVIWKIFTQILSALNECHQRKSGKILHRDIKPANIFLDDQNNIKLGDFGLSRMMGDQSLFAYTYVGTPYYMSPEQINESKYNERSDIWSAGCLLYEIAALRPPFEASNHLSLAIKIKAGKIDRIPIKYSEDLQRTIQFMLNINSDARPRAEDLMKIPEVSIRIHEKRLKEKTYQLKLREKEVKQKEENLREYEALVAQKEEEVLKLQSRLIDKKHSITRVKSSAENIDPNLQLGIPVSKLNIRSPNNQEKKLSIPKEKDKSSKVLSKIVTSPDMKYKNVAYNSSPLQLNPKKYSVGFCQARSMPNTRKSYEIPKSFTNL